MGKPELVDVICRHHLAIRSMERSADVRVAIYKPGRHKFSRAINLVVAGLRTTRRIDGQTRDADGSYLSDTTVLNDDVRRTPSGSACAVDDHRATQYESAKRSNATVPYCRCLYLCQSLFCETGDHFFANFNLCCGRVHAVSIFIRPVRAFDSR
jgi:hypothetical protein